MPQRKDKLRVSLDFEVINRIRELAIEDERSTSQYINHVLREHIKDIDTANQDR